jgi:hypothetical protein
MIFPMVVSKYLRLLTSGNIHPRTRSPIFLRKAQLIRRLDRIVVELALDRVHSHGINKLYLHSDPPAVDLDVMCLDAQHGEK